MPFICQNITKKTIVYRVFQYRRISRNRWIWWFTPLFNSTTHILIDRDENGILATEVFSEQQTSQDVLKILGYDKNKFTINQLVNLKIR
jgi:hypothetical protein